MLTQEEWVQSCLSKYRWEPLPANQQWEAAHFPLPECLGGKETVLLWSADHTVQGLLQSVELDHKCFYHSTNGKDLYNLETHYPEYLQLFAQLKSQFSRRQGKKGAATNKLNGTGAYCDPKVKSANGTKGALTNIKNKTGLFGQTTKQLITNGKRGGKIGGKTTGNQKWECLETGFIANPGNLSRYQNSRGIDTSLRTRRADLEG